MTGAGTTLDDALSPARLETFADGVFAIAATLLIIDVSVEAPGAELGAAIVQAWPQYAAYGVSFLLIGIWWLNHHTVMAVVERVDRPFLLANIALLGCIAFLPFPTRLVADHFRDSGVGPAAIAYGLTTTAAAFWCLVAWYYARAGRRLIAATADARQIEHISRTLIPGVPINLAATALTLLNPYLALALFAAITVFYALGSARIGRSGTRGKTNSPT
jgi:uncharacterized membrane protein